MKITMKQNDQSRTDSKEFANNTAYDRTLDLRNDKCPMPLIKTGKAVRELPVGKVLKVIATARGSLSIQAFAKTARIVDLNDRLVIQEGGVDLYVHYLRRTG